MDDEVTWSGSSNNKGPTIILIAIFATVIGSIAGVVGHSMFSEPVVVIPPPEVIKEELTEAELRALAEDLIATEQDRATAALERVQTLQEELAFKEAELSKIQMQKQKGLPNETNWKRKLLSFASSLRPPRKSETPFAKS